MTVLSSLFPLAPVWVRAGRLYSTTAGLSTLVLAEHDNSTVSKATLHAIAAAKMIGGPITLMVAGHDCGKAVEQAMGLQEVSRVLVADDAVLKGFLPEAVAPTVAKAVGQFKFSHIAAGATAFGKNVIPRLGALLDVNPISEVIGVVSPDTFTRPIYAGNAIATVKSHDSIKLLTVRSTAFPEVGPANGPQAERQTVDAVAAQGVEYIGQQLTKSERPELTNARIIVAGGRALKSAENFKILYDLADKLGAAVGASRAAVDAGYVPNDMQIGQTGKIVAPELYIAIGISGAIQHLAGMKDSKTIVAINKDADAPIFQVADYGLVADLFKAVPELQQKL